MPKLPRDISEILFLIATLIFWMMEGEVYHPLAIFLSLVFVQQIYFQNKLAGIFISGLLILSSIFFSFALISELAEFPIFDTDAQNLVLGGISVLIPIALNALMMLRKYLRLSIKTVPSYN